MPAAWEKTLSPAEIDMLNRARTFTRDVIEPNAGRWEAERRMPVEALRAAAKSGLLGLETPTGLGGLGQRYRLKLAVCEALARGDMAFTFSLINTQNVAARLALSPAGRHREEYVPELLSGRLFGATALSEPDAGSDFSSIRTRAERVSDGWRLNGEKAWITNTPIADLFLTYAQTDPAAGWRGIACFLVDARRPGFERGEAYAMLGGHAIGAGGFRLRDCFVPDENLLSPPGEGFKFALQGVNGARVYVAAMCAGMMASSLHTALEYGETRHAFGQPLTSHQGLRWSLVDVAGDLEALRALAWQAGELIDAEETAVTAAAHAKRLAGRVTMPAITACIQAMGAEGLRTSHALGRHLACAKIAAFTDGSTEMMNERIGADLVSYYAQDD